MRWHLVIILSEGQICVWRATGQKSLKCLPSCTQVFLLRRAIELLHAFVRQNIHPLTAPAFGDWLSPRARAHYHKSQINTVKSNDNSLLIRLRWNLDYSIKGSSQSSKGKVPVFFHLRYIYRIEVRIMERGVWWILIRISHCRDTMKSLLAQAYHQD